MQCAYCTFVTADPPAAFCPNCGTATQAPAYVSGPAPSRVSGLGTASAVLLGCVALTQSLFVLVRLSGHSTTAIAVAAAAVQAATIAVFLTWFYRVRRNAGLWEPQRRGQGWSIGAWFTPVVALWFPFQILWDVWWASEPATAPRRGPDAAAKAWWACWLLAWVTGFHTTHTTTTMPDGTTSQGTFFSVFLGGTVVSNFFAAAAAVLGLLVVGKVTRMQTARLGS